MVPFNNKRRQTMAKDDIMGFALIPFIIVGCIYREELTDFMGILLNNLFAVLG
jgi:hypothetical protein